MQVDSTYRTNKPKLMQDVRLLRQFLDGKIPQMTTNDPEQLRILIKKCRNNAQQLPSAPNFFDDITDSDKSTEQSIISSPVKANVTTTKPADSVKELEKKPEPNPIEDELQSSSSSESDDRHSHKKRKRKHRKRSGRKNRRRNIIESNEYQAGLPYFQTSISNPFLQVNPYQFVGPTQSFAHPNTNLRSVAQQTYSQLNHPLSQQNPYFFALQPPTFGSTSTTNNTRIHMGADNSNLEINSQAGQDDDQNGWYNLDTLVKAATHLGDN